MGLLVAGHLSTQLRYLAERRTTALEAHQNGWAAAHSGQKIELSMSVLIKLLACQPTRRTTYCAASMWMQPMDAA